MDIIVNIPCSLDVPDPELPLAESPHTHGVVSPQVSARNAYKYWLTVSTSQQLSQLRPKANYCNEAPRPYLLCPGKYCIQMYLMCILNVFRTVRPVRLDPHSEYCIQICI